MERVRDAISKARLERAAVQENQDSQDKQTRPDKQIQPGEPASLDTQTPPNASAVVLPLQAKRTTAEIEYTHTQTIALDDVLLEQNRVIAGFLHDERAEIYRQLRSQILPLMKASGWRTLALTSPGENAGKTLTAVNLAISISQEVNQTVMLVDLDLRKPSVHTTLGFEAKKGIADCINYGEPIENVLLNPQFKRLVVLPGRALGEYSSELLTSPSMQALMQEIVNRYESRIIIFDLPPLLRNDDALVFTPLVDATLLVVEDGVSTVDQVKRCLHLLEKSNLLGTILNKARD
jgi:protein-tyrosine kinase